MPKVWDWLYHHRKGGSTTQTQVKKSSTVELDIDRTFDARNRLNVISAAYFDVSSHQIADYDYTGPWRVRKKTLGEAYTGSASFENGTYLLPDYDGLRRTSEYVWKNKDNDVLVGFGYAYDDVGNLMSEQWHHDEDRYDNFRYDSLYRLDYVRYRDASALDYRSASGGAWTAGGNKENFTYDDNSNREGASQQDPFANEAAFADTYTINAANEYTQINRASTNTNPTYDRAGNMTTFPVIPGAGVEAGDKVNCTATYDAFNQMQSAVAGSNDRWLYRYDAVGRRFVEWKDQDNPFEGTRFIYDGYSVIQERNFTHYTQEGSEDPIYPSTADAHSKAHKIFVRGGGSILFSAVDGDLDGSIAGGDSISATDLNKPEYEEDPEGEETAYERPVEDRHDFAYYYLDNARGQVMALLARDMQYGINTPGEGGGEDQDKARILEYYKYNAFGSVTVLPVYDRDDTPASSVNSSGVFDSGIDDIPGSGSRTEWDLVENTPLTLEDNNTLMTNRRNGDNNHAAVGAEYGREGTFANTAVGWFVQFSFDVGLQVSRQALSHSEQGDFGLAGLTSTDAGDAVAPADEGPCDWKKGKWIEKEGYFSYDITLFEKYVARKTFEVEKKWTWINVEVLGVVVPVLKEVYTIRPLNAAEQAAEDASYLREANTQASLAAAAAKQAEEQGMNDAVIGKSVVETATNMANDLLATIKNDPDSYFPKKEDIVCKGKCHRYRRLRKWFAISNFEATVTSSSPPTAAEGSGVTISATARVFFKVTAKVRVSWGCTRQTSRTWDPIEEYELNVLDRLFGALDRGIHIGEDRDGIHD